jgi:hypothetical protein
MVTVKKGKGFFSSLVLLSVFFLILGGAVLQTPGMAQESRDARLAEIYETNRMIEETGARWVAGETSLSGLSVDEKMRLLGSLPPPITGDEEVLSPYYPLGSLPSSLDWRSNGGNFVTPIRNQSSCGSCWAFATTAALESATLIHNNTPGSDVNLSEQVMVSCGVSGSNDAGGCGGGYVSYASDHIRNTGLPLETCYPYTATDGNCGSACANWQSSAYKIASWSWVATTAPTVDAIKNALVDHGPLVTTFRVYEDFYDYSEGIYSYVTGAYLGGHAVLLVGYNDSEQCFIVKNSWGTWWGEDGYFKIAYSEVNGTTQFGDYTIAYGSAIPPNGETVSVPSSLSGNTGGTTNVSYSYSTGGSTSNSGHSVQYVIDWGDGTNSGWLGVGTASASKSWSSPGTYSVKSQARCSTDTTVVSSWSGSLGVTISCPVPGTPSSAFPSNSATGISTTPTLSWTSSGANSYDVYFGTASNPPLVTTTSSATYSPPSLSYGTTYYWKIVAKNSCGGSAAGAVWSFTTVCATLGTPSSPSPANGATGISTSPSLSWTGANASSYQVFFGTASNPPLVTTTTSATYSPAPLSNNTTYYWKIVAMNNCGNSATGGVWSFTTACGVPGAPSASSPLNGAAGISTNPTLTWSSSGASAYDVHFGTGSNPPLVVSGTASVSYSPATLLNNTKYYWKIVARNSCGGSTTGDVWSFTTACVASGTPAAPTPSNGATGVSTSPTLSWTGTNASSYDVYFGASPTPSLVTTTSGTTYSASGLNNSATYYWKVVARNACGDLTSGAVWSFTTVNGTGTPVTVIGPNGGETLPMGSPYTVRWSAPAQATKFNVAYSTNNGSTWKTIASNVTGSSYTWQVPSLKKSLKSCRVRVIGLDSQGVKIGDDRSDSVFSILGVRVTGPTLGETLTEGSTHTITWETLGSVGPVGDARVYYSKNGGGGWTLIGTVPGGTNSYVWTVPSTKGVLKNTCRIKVVLRDPVKKTLTADISDGYFTMQPAGSQ